jgi:hypothetical protein
VKGLKPNEWILAGLMRLGDGKLSKFRGRDFDDMIENLMGKFTGLDEDSAWTAMNIGVFHYIKWRVMCTARKAKGRPETVNLVLSYLIGFLLRPEGHSQRKGALRQAANAGEMGILNENKRFQRRNFN